MVIFFDIDDTLINQRQAEAAAACALLRAYGDLFKLPSSVPELCRVWRKLREKHAPPFFAGLISLQEHRRRRIRELFDRAGAQLSAAESDALFDFYERHYRRSWTLFDDVLPSLKALREHRCGIISNGSTAQQTLKLFRTGIDRYFDIVVVSEDAGAAKPQREIFLEACRQADSPAEHCVYVGDRLEQDALASRAIGMHSFWLDRSRAHQRAPVEVINTLAQLSWKLENGIAV
jgi:putative hydrolase of the HAD superfamily